MTAVFASALLTGVVVLIAWIAATVVAQSVEGFEHVNPESRFGRIGRFVLAGLLGFGMAGMSASFAGWPSLAALVSAVLGAVALIGVGAWLGPRPEPDHAPGR